MSERQAAGSAILATVFVGMFVASGLTMGWLTAALGWGGAVILAPVVIYGVTLMADAT